jgi:hypothetical protein
MVDKRGKGVGYKAQIRALRKETETLKEALNLAALDVKKQEAYKETLQLIVLSDQHGYRPACDCEDCKEIRSVINGLVFNKMLKEPEKKSLIIQP